ncbi:DNA/RNA non-specific endonuclease [Pelosinus sp. IPA-1]|uniref:DNA/RNA non-specific endonuclease n=1 Tax=Pelosinus sp. IPA-1 TaxID=3029569 RepID=UPI002436192E|nr:DNA/RNA non-specific endonuclease [Pelosinus sp. IPA-1]GMB02147.1 hypothetical protein PIPA1_49470 [Pelosinus sp. IPA-1]
MSIILCDNLPKSNMDLVNMQQENALKRTSESEDIAHTLESKNPLEVETDDLVTGISKESELAGYRPEEMLVAELRNEWYEDLAGYDPTFLDNSVTVPLPKLRSDLEQDIALLKNGHTVLNYTHFSILMSKSRRLAYYTAVNIHGDLLVKVKRTKDEWYFDPRIEREYQCGPELYKKSDFTRGHLVRRRDPAWGESAKKANKDTFHFTNCSPQHQNLNQKTWLDLEDYILNNADTFNLKVTVFTGPVFRIDDMFYRGFQIPAEFWKVVVMVKTDGTLSATAYLQTQKNLLRDYEFAYGSYKTYQVPISNIENLTGLNFGDLRSYDLLGRIKATTDHLEPTIVHVIENPEDIKL